MPKIITDKQKELLVRMCDYSLKNNRNYKLRYHNGNAMKRDRIKDIQSKVTNDELTCKQASDIISDNLDEYLIVKRLNIPKDKDGVVWVMAPNDIGRE